MPPLRGTVVYLVRSFRTNARIRSLTTGTFNRVVKDPNRLPPERRAFSSRRTHYESESGCPRNLSTISFARNPVNLHIPQHLHMISTCELCSDLGYWGAKRLATARNGMAFRFGRTLHRISALGFLGHAKAEDRKLRKDP